MMIMSHNVRGLGGNMKRRPTCNWIRAQGAEIIFLQETKIGLVSKLLCATMWGGSEVELKKLPVVNSVGGAVFFGVGFMGMERV